MYFPTSAARQLSTIPALPNLPPEPVICLRPSPRKALFCTLTRNGVSVWRVRPPAVLSFLSRTPTSLLDHGENVDVQWSPDSSRLVIKTSESNLVVVSVEFRPEETVYRAPPLPPNAQRNFLAGPGEGLPFQSIVLRFEGVIRVEGTLLSVSPRRHHLTFSTKTPPTIQRIPWPTDSEDTDQVEAKELKQQHGYDTWIFNEHGFSWLIDFEVSVTQIIHSRVSGVEAWITSDGRVYFVHLHQTLEVEENDNSVVQSEVSGHRFSLDSVSTTNLSWRGTCVYNFETPRWVQKQRRVEPDEPPDVRHRVYEEPRRAVALAINGKFSFVAIGTFSGGLEFVNFPSQEGVTPKSKTIQIPNPYNRVTGEVCALEWSSDGYVLAVGWKHGWGIFSVGGRCLASGFGVDDVVDEDNDEPMLITSQFWAPGNYELLVLSQPSSRRVDNQLFVTPFAKSATTGQHSPDNTRYAFLQMDDRVLVYRGADQPDMSVINPESDVWQHIKIPQSYLATNWPIQYSSLSSDGRLIAIAGRKGLVHYSSTSGRWKTFNDEQQEQAFTVKGGLLWFHHVLIAAVEVSKAYQIRLYSRDMELSNQNVLHREVIPSQVVILSLVDNSLLVYSADNTLYHFLIVPTTETIKLHLCGSITFNGIITAPSAVRMLSWMIPSAQKQLGDPVDDLSVATVLMVVGGQLVLLRPRKSANQEVKYDMQIFADRVEFCWIHLRGIGTLENSLWAYDGQGMRVWLNALAIEAPEQQGEYGNEPESVKESVNIPLDFYPLSCKAVLMDKGIIIGVEHETATRSNLTFVIFRHTTSIKEAVAFASHYKNLVYFAHALEILLHTVVESEATLEIEDYSEDNELASDAVLPTVVEFLDHFDAALDVVVGCARKTELTRWRRLFSVVGNPKLLFENCLASQRLKTAGSYLLVLHNLEQLDETNDDAVRLLQNAVDANDWQLCRELLRFLHSVDDTGAALKNALSKTNVVSFLEQDCEVSSISSASP
ncbi:hypothetical protein H0H93_013032 [Arthromyces matolae]|nr:hypothetical protein H0H93_013032 [Arthromyces matolae]